jgi:predicted protein tyrosine phosphatase
VKAWNISQQHAEEIFALPPRTVMISITGEYAPRASLNIPDDSRLLRVAFADIRADSIIDGKMHHVIQEGTVRKILRFTRDNKDKDFIVHCRAGISRSSAICLYLHMMYGHDLKSLFWENSAPNEFVLGALWIHELMKK